MRNVKNLKTLTGKELLELLETIIKENNTPETIPTVKFSQESIEKEILSRMDEIVDEEEDEDDDVEDLVSSYEKGFHSEEEDDDY